MINQVNTTFSKDERKVMSFELPEVAAYTKKRYDTSFFDAEVLSLSPPHPLSLTHSLTHSINQSINQSINASINQSINRSINESINQPTNQSTNRSINQSINRSIN